MDAKQKKKRIAHNSSAIGGGNETTAMADDFVSDIMNSMNLTHSNTTSIISYQQLEDIRKQKKTQSKQVETLGECNDQNNPNLLQQRKLIKKNHPLMAKCQRNLKILKHNRSIPKPRAHVGAQLNAAPSPSSKAVSTSKSNKKFKSKKDSSKCLPSSSQTKAKTKSKVDFIRNIIAKPSTPASKLKKRYRLSDSDISDRSSVDKIDKNRSKFSESESDFEKFVKTHNVVNRHKIPTSSDSSSDELNYLKPRNPKKKSPLKRKRNVSNVENKLSKNRTSKRSDSRMQRHEEISSDEFDCAAAVDDNHVSSDESDVGGKNIPPTRTLVVPRENLEKKRVSSGKSSVEGSNEPVTKKRKSTSSKKKRTKIKKVEHIDKACPVIARANSLSPIVSALTEDTEMHGESEHHEHASIPESFNDGEDWVVMKCQNSKSEYTDTDPLKNDLPISDSSIQIESVYSLDPTDHLKSCNDFHCSDSDIEVLFNHNSNQNTTTHAMDTLNKSDNGAITVKNEDFVEKDVSISQYQSSTVTANIKSVENIKTYEHDVRSDPMSAFKVKEEILEDEEIQVLPFKIVPVTDDKQCNYSTDNSHADFEATDSDKLVSNKESEAYEKLSQIDIGLIKKYIEEATVPQPIVKKQPNDSDIEVICLEADDETSNRSPLNSSQKTLILSKIPFSDVGKQCLKEAKTDVHSISSRATVVNSEAETCSKQKFETEFKDQTDANNSKTCSNFESIAEYNIYKAVKSENICSDAPDELDNVAASSIEDLDGKKSNNAIRLLDLYKEEYERYIQIRSTEQNVSAGLKLLEEKQLKKLKHLKAAIKNISKKDPCFNKLHKKHHKHSRLGNKEPKTRMSDPSSSGTSVKIEQNNESKINEQANSEPTTFKCVECEKPAQAACQGCKKVYYCSSNCGLASWNKGHSTTCEKQQ